MNRLNKCHWSSHGFQSPLPTHPSTTQPSPSFSPAPTLNPSLCDILAAPLYSTAHIRFVPICPSFDDSLATDLPRVNKIFRCRSVPRRIPTAETETETAATVFTKTPNTQARRHHRINCSLIALNRFRIISTIHRRDLRALRVMRQPTLRPQT